MKNTPKNGVTVRIISSSFNRHKIDSTGTIKHHVFDLWEFLGEDGLYSVFTPDEFEVISAPFKKLTINA